MFFNCWQPSPRVNRCLAPHEGTILYKVSPYHRIVGFINHIRVSISLRSLTDHCKKNSVKKSVYTIYRISIAFN